MDVFTSVPPVAMLLLPVTVRAADVWAQVVEGESEVVNIRDTNDRLGPLILGLVALGVVTMIGTLIFWFLTRPGKADQRREHVS